MNHARLLSAKNDNKMAKQHVHLINTDTFLTYILVEVM